MPTIGEFTYFERIGESGRSHALNKPFSDDETARSFLDMGAIFALLPKAPDRVLECGCGTGWLSYFLARKGYDVVGQDCNADAVALAKSHPVFSHRGGSVEFVCSDFEKLDYSSEFDAVVFYAALHHSQSEDRTIASAYKALRPGGVLIAVEPGVGHAAKSQAAINEYQLGDRDMPPYLVIRHGKRAGFKEWAVFQHAGQLASTLYGQPPHSSKLRRLWAIPGTKLLALLSSVVFLKRFNGTVWMRK